MPTFQPYWGNPPYGMIGGSTRRRHHAKPGPRLDPTQLRGARRNPRPYRDHWCWPNDSSSLRLVDIPEDRRRRAVEHAGQRFPPRARRQILPERDIDHLLIDLLLDLGGDLLLLFRRQGAREGIAQGFDIVVLRPAEPAAALAPAADRHIGDRVDHVGSGPVGEEHVPAALLDRLLAGAAADHGAPVGRLHIDLESG